MGDSYKKVKELLEKELDKIAEKGTIDPTNLEYSYKIVDIIKDIYEICEKEDNMYDEESSGRRGYGMRRSRYYPYMGEYRVEGTYGRGRSGDAYGRGYSNASSMKAKLHQLMDETDNDRERMMIQSWMDDLA